MCKVCHLCVFGDQIFTLKLEEDDTKKAMMMMMMRFG